MIVIAAFRARSLLRFGFEDACEGPDEGEGSAGAIGLDFWASFSDMLTLEVSSVEVEDAGSCCPVSRGGLVSLISGVPPAIEVSGTPLFRGGGGGKESSECGR